MTLSEKRKMLFELTVHYLTGGNHRIDSHPDSKLKTDFDAVYKLLNEKWESSLVRNTK